MQSADRAPAQTGIGGKNEHVVDQSGLIYCRRNGLVGVLFPATLPCSKASQILALTAVFRHSRLTANDLT